MTNHRFWLKLGKVITYIRRCVGLNEAKEIVLVTETAQFLCALEAEVEENRTFIYDRLQGR